MSEPVQQTPHDEPTRKRPVVWMIVAGVAVAAAVGLGIYAVVLNDDLDETEAQLSAQSAAADQASEEAERRAAEARERGQAALSALGDIEGIFVVTEDEVTEAEQAAAEAEAAAEDAQSDVEQAQAERDQARAEAEQARLCAGGSLGALNAVYENEDPAQGLEESTESVESVSGACEDALSETP